MSDEKAPFNMAIATLERLSDILREITKLEQSFMLLEMKQERKVYLVKDFYRNAVPLLTKKHREELQPKIVQLLPKEQTILITKHGLASRENGKRVVYDASLDLTLNELLVDVQVFLQEEKFFMPPRKDRGKAVAEF